MNAPMLHRLLDRIDDAVTRADLVDLAELVGAMEGAVQEFNLAADPKAASALSERARRIAGRLDAARRGVQSARRRLQEIRAACDLRTYDRTGQAHSLTAGTPPTAHRF